MAIHQWNGRPIAHKDHHADLERDSAALEFGLSRLDRKAAEEAAHQAYKLKMHGDAIKHHLHGMRASFSQGSQEDGEKHNALYNLHMKALGMRPGSLPPVSFDPKEPFTEGHEFSPHPSDQLLVHGSMSKSERDTFFKIYPPTAEE